MNTEKTNLEQGQPALSKGDVMGWRFLPEMPEEKKEVLVAFKWFNIPVQAYWDGETWKASFEVRDVMKDGYCNDSALCMQEDIYAWMELPVKPACP